VGSGAVGQVCSMYYIVMGVGIGFVLWATKIVTPLLLKKPGQSGHI
jgi:hypothetical protein